MAEEVVAGAPVGEVGSGSTSGGEIATQSPSAPAEGAAGAGTSGGEGQHTPSSNTQAGSREAAPTGVPRSEGEIDYDALSENVEDEPPPARQPPATGQFEVNTLPEPMKAAFGISEYVKTPENMQQAVRAAAEVWDVQTGRKDAGEFLDAMREHNPQAHLRAVQQIVPYLKYLNEQGVIDANALGLTFGQPTQSEHPDVAKLRGEVTQMRTQQQQREQAESQQREQARNNEVRQTLESHLSEQVKGTWLEGDATLHSRVLQKMMDNKVGLEAFDAAYAKKDFSAYDRALKQVKNDILEQVKGYNKNLREHSARLRATTPASPGSGAKQPKQPGSLPAREDYPEGEDGLMQWQTAYGKASGLIQ